MRSGFLTSTAILAARLARSSRSCSLRSPVICLVGFVDGGLVDLELHLRRLEVQRQRGLVADRFLERVAAHVALLVLVGAEGPEGVAVGAVDGRAGEAEEEGIGQRLAHLAAQVAFLRAVRLVHHHDDVRALVEPPPASANLWMVVMSTLRTSCASSVCSSCRVAHADHVRHVGGVEGGGDLRVEVDAVHHDHHRGVAQPRVHAQLLRGKDHQQRLAAALEVPDQALLRDSP